MVSCRLSFPGVFPWTSSSRLMVTRLAISLIAALAILTLWLPGHASAEDTDGVRAGSTVTPAVLESKIAEVESATDLADTRENRARLVGLARGAHTLFCEAGFLTEDAAQAARTGHLTARACGEIAEAAEVGQLVPFHFSRRYEREPQRIYAEVRAACSRVPMPGPMTWEDG